MCQILKYADDLTFYTLVKKDASSQQLIQAALNNNMLIIADKTQLINVSLTVPDLTNTYV